MADKAGGRGWVDKGRDKQTWTHDFNTLAISKYCYYVQSKMFRGSETGVYTCRKPTPTYFVDSKLDASQFRDHVICVLVSPHFSYFSDTE